MKKIVSLIVLFLFPVKVFSLNHPVLDSKTIEVYDLTDNKVLYEVNSSKTTSIASLTKIATVLTSIENIKNIDEKVTISKEILDTVSVEASRAGLKQGDMVTYEDLLYCSMLPSGADCTQALAILNSGSIDKFVEKMNKLVKEIGLTNTHFVNVTGLDEKEHYSTAEDIRKLLVYALKKPLFRKIYTTKEYKLSNGLLVKTTLYKYNANKSDINKILGSKTGYTTDAGYCLSSLSTINKHEIIIIVLNSSQLGNKFYNVIDTIKLINFIGENYKEEKLVEKGHMIKEIPVNLSDIDTYQIKASNDVLKFLPNDYNKDNLKIEYDGVDNLSYKNKKDSKIGVINYYFEDELILKEDVILDKIINLNIIKLIKKYFLVIIAIILLIVFLIIKKYKLKKRREKLLDITIKK